MANLKFYRGAEPTSASLGTIWFDSANKVLKVKTSAGWESYNNNASVKNATFSNNLLTITKYDGAEIKLNFSDVASAKETMAVFNALDTDIKAAKAQADKGVADAAAALSAAQDAQSTADSKLAGVNGSYAIEANSEGGIATVALKINTTNEAGNVTLTQDENGLKANVVIPECDVHGFAPDDDILDITDGRLLTATVALDYGDATTAALAGKKAIKLLGKENVVLSEIDASEFIKDGMIDTVVYDSENKKATITWNTAAGKDATVIDLTGLVDTYAAGDGLTLTGNTFAVAGTVAKKTDVATAKTEANEYADGLKTTIDAYKVNGKAISTNPTLAAGDLVIGGSTANSTKTVQGAVEDLYTKVDAAAAGGVLSFAGKAGHITLAAASEANGAVNLTLSEDKKLGAAIVGLGSAAYAQTSAFDAAGAADAVLGTSADAATANTVYGVKALANSKATSAQGAKADSALQGVSATGSNYVTASFAEKDSNKAQALSVSATVQAVSSASSSAKGLAEASDVKAYVDNHVAQALEWVVFE